MTRHFFITGLPRSRTAWMANFFTTGESFCFHDAMKDGFDMATLRAAFESAMPRNYDYLGDADSGLLLCPGQVYEAHPFAPWLFIRNTPERSAASFEEYFRKVPYPGVPLGASMLEAMKVAEIYYREALEIVPEQNRIEVEMSDLENPEVMRKVWQWLVPELPWDEKRYRLLDGLRVNVMQEKVKFNPTHLRRPAYPRA